MPINVSEALDSETAELITVRRISGSGYQGRLWVEGTASTFKTLASVQQPTPKEIETLPDGDKVKDLRKFVSKKPIRTSSDKDQLQADEVLYRGNWYKIISSSDWDTYGYTRSIGARDK